MAYNEFKTKPPDTLYVMRKGALYDNRVYAGYDKVEDINAPEHLNGCEVAIYKLERVAALNVSLPLPPPPPPLTIEFVDKKFAAHRLSEEK